MFKRSFQRLAALPWAKTLKAAAWFVAGFTLLVGVPGAFFSSTDFTQFFTNIAVSLVVSLVLALYGVGIFTYIWATSDVPQSWANLKKFWREFPENWCRFWRGVGAVLYWIMMLPMTIGRAGDRFLRWLGSLPSRWRAMPSKDKGALVFMVLGFKVMGVVGYLYWGLASHWASGLPHWVHDGDVLMPTLVIDAFLTAFTVIIGMTLLGIVFDVVKHVIRRNRAG